MTELIKQQSRREYFRKYYLLHKNKKLEEKNIKSKRGRPRKQIPKLSFEKLKLPITIYFD